MKSSGYKQQLFWLRPIKYSIVISIFYRMVYPLLRQKAVATTNYSISLAYRLKKNYNRLLEAELTGMKVCPVGWRRDFLLDSYG